MVARTRLNVSLYVQHIAYLNLSVNIVYKSETFELYLPL